MPSLIYSLLSISQLCEISLELYFSSHSCHVQDPRMGRLVRTGYKIEHPFKHTDPYVLSDLFTTLGSSTSTLNL